jgi:hypothetical protein
MTYQGYAEDHPLPVLTLTPDVVVAIIVREAEHAGVPVSLSAESKAAAQSAAALLLRAIRDEPRGAAS